MVLRNLAHSDMASKHFIKILDHFCRCIEAPLCLEKTDLPWKEVGGHMLFSLNVLLLSYLVNFSIGEKSVGSTPQLIARAV